ncbi:hypothetical protein EMCRGX_G002766 [Ephydatia muelleri]
MEGACVPDAAVCRKYESRVPNLLTHFLISCNNDFEGIPALCSLRVVYSSEERVRTICCEQDELTISDGLQQLKQLRVQQDDPAVLRNSPSPPSPSAQPPQPRRIRQVNYTVEQDLTLRAVPHHVLEVDVLWKGSGTYWHSVHFVSSVLTTKEIDEPTLIQVIITPPNASQELIELLCGLLEKDPAMRLGTQHLQGAVRQAYGEAEEDLDRQRQHVEKDHTKLSEEALQELAKQAMEIIATEKEELTYPLDETGVAALTSLPRKDWAEVTSPGQAYGEAEEDLDRQRQRVEKDRTKLSEEALQELAKQAVEIIATEKEELTFIEAHCTQDIASIGVGAFTNEEKVALAESRANIDEWKASIAELQNKTSTSLKIMDLMDDKDIEKYRAEFVKAANTAPKKSGQAYGEAEEDLDRQRQRVEKDHTKLSEEALQELAKQAVEIIATEKEELTSIEAHCTQDIASIEDGLGQLEELERNERRQRELEDELRMLKARENQLRD